MGCGGAGFVVAAFEGEEAEYTAWTAGEGS